MVLERGCLILSEPTHDERFRDLFSVIGASIAVVMHPFIIRLSFRGCQSTRALPGTSARQAAERGLI